MFHDFTTGSHPQTFSCSNSLLGLQTTGASELRKMYEIRPLLEADKWRNTVRAAWGAHLSRQLQKLETAISGPSAEGFILQVRSAASLWPPLGRAICFLLDVRTQTQSFASCSAPAGPNVTLLSLSWSSETAHCHLNLHISVGGYSTQAQ